MLINEGFRLIELFAAEVKLSYLKISSYLSERYGEMKFQFTTFYG